MNIECSGKIFSGSEESYSIPSRGSCKCVAESIQNVANGLLKPIHINLYREYLQSVSLQEFVVAV